MDAIEPAELRCEECGRFSGAARHWRAYLVYGDDELEIGVPEPAFYCPRCAQENFPWEFRAPLFPSFDDDVDGL